MFVAMSNGETPKQRPGAERFLIPCCAPQRQYEALRSYLVEGLPAAEAAARFGYSTTTLYSLCRDLRAGRLQFFQAGKPGPKTAPKRDAVRERVIELRKLNYSIYDIQKLLQGENVSVSHVLINKILREEGFARLPRRREVDRPCIVRPDVAEVADVRRLNWNKFAQFETQAGGLFIFVPTLVEWGFEHWISRAGLPGSRMIPPSQSILSLLALKLTGKERISHVMDVYFDPGFALFAGLNALPKTTALSTYSYRVTRGMTLSLLDSYVRTMSRSKLLPGKSFNLDFHAIPQRGEKAVLEKHYISKRSRRERAVLTFFVQDGDSRVLCYTNATVRKDSASEEILNFVEFWRQTRGKAPPHLVFDSQLTTYDVLDRLDREGILFITLRRRGRVLMHNLETLPASAWKRMRLSGVSRRYRTVYYTESSVKVRPLRRHLRQVAVRGLGHEKPTLFLTNDSENKTAELVERYARRMLIENGIAENIDFFHLDALCSAITIQVDLDVMLTLIANALYRHLAKQLVGFETSQPKQIFRRFLNTPARVTVTPEEVRIKIRRLAHHPILLDSGILKATPVVPWWEGRTLHLEVR
jgi:transposase